MAERHEFQLSVFQNRRWDIDSKTVKKLSIRDFWAIWWKLKFILTSLNTKFHKEISNYASGSLYDLRPHIIDQTLVLFGMPKAVYAHLDSFRKDGKVTDYFDLKLYYEAKIVTLKSSFFVCEHLSAYVFHSATGSFIKSKALNSRN